MEAVWRVLVRYQYLAANGGHTSSVSIQAPAEHCEHSLLQTSNQPPARLHSVSRRNNVDTNIKSIRYLFLSVSQTFSFNLKRSSHTRKPISRHQLKEINQDNLSRLRDLDLIIFICPCPAEAAGGRYQKDVPPTLFTLLWRNEKHFDSQLFWQSYKSLPYKVLPCLSLKLYILLKYKH